MIKPNKTRRTIQVVKSDTHGGCKIGLMNPETVLYQEDEDGNLTPYQPHLTAPQRYLWGIYTEAVQFAKELAGKDDILVLDLGDECHGNKYPQTLVSTRLTDQITIADYNMRPWFEIPNVKAFRQVAGTQAHGFGEGSSAIQLCQILQARYPSASIRPLYHGLLEYNGVTNDFSHHGPHPGSRNWLRGNVARFYLRDLMQRDIMEGRRPPQLVWRGHYHSPVYEKLETGADISELYVMPSFCFLDDHSIQATQSQFEVTHGLAIVEIIDGKVIEVHRLYHTKDIRTKEVL